MITIKNKIRYFRKRLGLSQEELAICIKKSKSTVCRYEKNQIQPPDNIKFKIAKTLKQNIIDIFFQQDVE